MISTAGLQTSADNERLADEISSLRLAAKQVVYARLEAARKSEELPAKSDIISLAAFFAMVSQGMSVQARDGAGEMVLKRMVKLAMKAWPQ